MKMVTALLSVAALNAALAAEPSVRPAEAWRMERAACYARDEAAFGECMRGAVKGDAFLAGIHWTARARPVECALFAGGAGQAAKSATSADMDRCLWSEPRKNYRDLSDTRAMIRHCLTQGEARAIPHYEHFVIYSSEVICVLEPDGESWVISEVTGRG